MVSSSSSFFVEGVLDHDEGDIGPQHIEEHFSKSFTLILLETYGRTLELYKYIFDEEPDNTIWAPAEEMFSFNQDDDYCELSSINSFMNLNINKLVMMKLTVKHHNEKKDQVLFSCSTILGCELNQNT